VGWAVSSREKIPDQPVGYAEARRIATHSTEIPRPDRTGDQATGVFPAANNREKGFGVPGRRRFTRSISGR